ncbi:MAG: hypothetical protein Crog4KO_30080 [Crocinitomicaceae bacterium]
MKYIALITLFFAHLSTTFAQQSEDLVPEEAITVLSIDNINLLQKISLDELVQYRFMEELHHDIIDGSTTGWTLKDSGIDFDQKLNVFQGGNDNFFVSGLTFGVEDKERLFRIFDDFERIDSRIDGVEMHASYFNRLALQNNNAVLYRVTPNYRKVSRITDSIWYARGNGYHWNEYDIYEEDFEMNEEVLPEDWDEESWESEGEGIVGKTYYELMDSVETALSEEYLEQFAQNLLVEGNSLIKSNSDFAAQLQSSSEGSYFVNNTANFLVSREFEYMERRHPEAYARMKEIYNGNILSGNFYIDDNTIKLDLKAQYGEALGAIYKDLGSAKFDKNFLPYIHEDDIAYATVHADYENASDKIYETAMSVVTKSDRDEMVAMSVVFDILYTFIDKETLFETVKGNTFMTFRGIQKVKTKKIVFDYDEETFEYIEREEEAEEDMPIFTWGLGTENHAFIEKMLNHAQRSANRNTREGASKLINHGEYWEITNGMFRSVSLFIINKNGVFIVTNDAALAQNNSNGYGSDAIAKKRMKPARKGGAIYAYADMNRAIDELPKEVFSERENEMLDIFRGKSGRIELTSEKSSGLESNYALTYSFESEEDSGTYILDLINSLYVISK